MKKQAKKEEENAGETAERGSSTAAPEAAAGGAPAATPAAELAALKDRHLRLQADFDNFRKRTARERQDAHRQALEELMQELLPVIDHLEMGLNSAAAQKLPEGLLDGFRLVWDQLNGVLRRFGLAPIDADGRPFDPHRHESVAQVPSDRHPRDAVVEQTRRGYVLGHRLLRPAQVVLSSGPPESAPVGGGAAGNPPASAEGRPAERAPTMDASHA